MSICGRRARGALRRSPVGASTSSRKSSQSTSPDSIEKARVDDPSKVTTAGVDKCVQQPVGRTQRPGGLAIEVCLDGPLPGALIGSGVAVEVEDPPMEVDGGERPGVDVQRVVDAQRVLGDRRISEPPVSIQDGDGTVSIVRLHEDVDVGDRPCTPIVVGRLCERGTLQDHVGDASHVELLEHGPRRAHEHAVATPGVAVDACEPIGVVGRRPHRTVGTRAAGARTPPAHCRRGRPRTATSPTRPDGPRPGRPARGAALDCSPSARQDSAVARPRCAIAFFPLIP